METELEKALERDLRRLATGPWWSPVAAAEARFWRLESALRAANKALRRAHRKHEAWHPCCRCKKPAPRGFEWCVECRERTPETRSKSLNRRACRHELCGNLKWNRMVNAASRFT